MTTNTLIEGVKVKCCFCIDGNRPINVTESNENFVIARIEEENLDVTHIHLGQNCSLQSETEEQ